MWLAGINKGEYTGTCVIRDEEELIPFYNNKTGETITLKAKEVKAQYQGYSGCGINDYMQLVVCNRRTNRLYGDRIKIVNNSEVLIEKKTYVLVDKVSSGEIQIISEIDTKKPAYIFFRDRDVSDISLSFCWCEMLDEDTMLITLNISVALEYIHTEAEFYVRLIVKPKVVYVNSISREEDGSSFEYECVVPPELKLKGVLGAKLSLIGR